MNARWIALRIVAEIIRDKRTLAFFFLVPIIVMTLIYYAVANDEVARIGIVSRGMARLFDMEFVNALSADEDVTIVYLEIPDDEIDPERLQGMIRQELLKGKADGILYLSDQLLIDRFSGKRGEMLVYVEGSKPMVTSAVFSALADAMDELAEQLPVVIDAECSAGCANSVNNKAMEMNRIYLFGSDDYRVVDFFLPVLPTFFVFFFTFIISAITFQRERLRGTLERLYVAPVSFWEIVLGYILGFGLFAVVQSAIIVIYILELIEFEFSPAQVGGLAVVVGMTMLVALMTGLLASLLAHNEFQALQFIPLIILPQVFLSDLIWDINGFPVVFKWISYLLPLTHANIAARDIMIKNNDLIDSFPQLAILGLFFVVILGIMSAVAGAKEKSF